MPISERRLALSSSRYRRLSFLLAAKTLSGQAAFNTFARTIFNCILTEHIMHRVYLTPSSGMPIAFRKCKFAGIDRCLELTFFAVRHKTRPESLSSAISRGGALTNYFVVLPATSEKTRYLSTTSSSRLIIQEGMVSTVSVSMRCDHSRFSLTG
jgi:hypothetical protein